MPDGSVASRSNAQCTMHNAPCGCTVVPTAGLVNVQCSEMWLFLDMEDWNLEPLEVEFWR